MGKKEAKSGTLFPVDTKGGRSTTYAGKQALAAALRGAGEPIAAANVEKLGNKKWRFGYNKSYMTLVKASCKSPDAALGAAKEGLAYMYDNFEHAKSEKEPPVKFSAMLKAEKRSFETGVVKGKARKKAGGTPYEVPYDGGWSPSYPNPPKEGSAKSGDALKELATGWVKKGVVEADAAEAIHWTVDYFGSGKDLSKCYFVLIGAGSAMGPFSKLLAHGANVVALDIPGSWGKGTKKTATVLWDRLFAAAEASTGTLTFPKDPELAGAPDNEAAGCDLMSQPARIANWLVAWQKTLPLDAVVTIGNYTYLDGELHVKLALCADACIDALIKAAAKDKRPTPTVAFLCTPTDIHVVPPEVSKAAKKNGSFLHCPGWLFLKAIQLLSFGKSLVPNGLAPVPTEKGKEPLYLCDGLSVAQGPNYALAKRMQHWRAQVAYDGGATVSSMVAPSTATVSVIHNKTFAWAYGGMPFFKFEVFKQETTNAVMAAVMIRDVLDPNSPKNPKNRLKGSNTLELFKSESVHGGLWRAPYKVDTLGEVSVLIYFLGGPKLFMPIMMLLSALICGAICMYAGVL